MDLVVNHTSNGHPWFEAARADRASPFRDYYVWSDDPASEAGTTEENWTWDDEAGQYYQHQFAPFQPDLNIANPAVRHQIAKTVGFWLDARRVGLPHGRRAVPRAGDRRARRRGRPARASAGCTRCASTRCAAAAT